MGLLVSVLRDAGGGDCTGGGLSSRYTQFVIVNVEGPIDSDARSPPVILEAHAQGKYVRIVPAVYMPPGKWMRDPRWWMMGGNFAYTSDSRFSEACERLLGHSFYGAVAVHDRWEG